MSSADVSPVLFLEQYRRRWVSLFRIDGERVTLGRTAEGKTAVFTALQIQGMTNAERHTFMRCLNQWFLSYEYRCRGYRKNLSVQLEPV